MSGPTKGIEEIPVRPLTQATAEADGRPRRLRVEANLPCALRPPWKSPWPNGPRTTTGKRSGRWT